MSLSVGHVRLRVALLISAIALAFLGGLNVAMGVRERHLGARPATRTRPAIDAGSSAARSRFMLITGTITLAIAAGTLLFRRTV